MTDEPAEGSCAPHNSTLFAMRRAVSEALPIVPLFARLFPGAVASASQQLVFCPFHDNTHSPALHLMTRVNRYKCYGCGARGDPADLVRQALARLGPDHGEAHAIMVAARLAGISEAFGGAADVTTLGARLALMATARETHASAERSGVAQAAAYAERMLLARLRGVRRRDDDALDAWLDWLDDELTAAAADPDPGVAMARVRALCASYDRSLAAFDAAEDWEVFADIAT